MKLLLLHTLRPLLCFMLDYSLITDPNDLALKSMAAAVSGPGWWRVPEVVRALKDVLKKTKGVGIAAPQIGVNLRIFMLYDGSVFINPSLAAMRGNKKRGVEGCLSVPGKFLEIGRYQSVKITYQDVDRKAQFDECGGLDAVIVQHEMDHLNGRLITHYEEER